VKRVMTVVGLALVLTACGGGRSSPNGIATPTQDLVPAQHPECAHAGAAIEHYLVTGDTGGDPSLDQNYASERASILGQPSASRAGLVRSDADNAIQTCDQQLTEQAQAAAQARADAAAAQQQAQAAAAAAQQQAQADAAANAKYRAACHQHGGAPTTDNTITVWVHNADPAGEHCYVTYNGNGYEVPLNSDSSFDSNAAASNKSSCDGDTANAQSAAQAGVPWTQLPAYHADTGVCFEGSP
jgi:hypothetical protein